MSSDSPSVASDAPSNALDVLLKKTQDKSWVTFAPDELSALLSAFSPTQPVTVHTKGYLVLSAYCQRRRSEASSPDEGTQSISRAFDTPVTTRIADTEEKEALDGLTFLSALFDVDHASAAVIFQRDGTLEAIMDALDLFPKSPNIDIAVAHLLGRAAGHKTCRALLGTDHRNWLEWKSRQADNAELRAAAAVAMVKLARGSSADAAEAGGTPEQPTMQDDELAALMKGLVVDARETSSLADAVEGLAYMSTNPTVKETLSKDSAFLQRLFALVPRRKGATAESLGDSIASPLYGIVVIISNLCAYRPRLSAEEAQILKLRRMAKTAKDPGQSQGQVGEEGLDPLDDDDCVKERGRRLIKAGAMEALTSAVRATDSRAVRTAVGKAILNLVEDKDNRGEVLRSGGAKALQTIIQGFLPPSQPAVAGKIPEIEKEDFEPIQALAKLAITSAPVQVFGPNDGAVYDAIRPFALMVTHPNASLLQRFEAMMALTNLSSQSPEAASRIARADGLMNKVELLMLEDHTLVRRAATELVCNLVAGSEEMFNKWGGDKNMASKSKLQVLIALCDVEDLPTRLAASGALASLTASPDACESLAELQRERNRVLPILGQLVDPTVVSRPEADEGVEDEAAQLEPDPGLAHRGVVCLRNFFVGLQNKPTEMEIASEADRVGVVRALVGVVKTCAQSPSSPILRPAAEALKWLLEHGVEISV
ncbi:ARM repeat-containing protein [Polyporus arcularius HHB13444]|uniref:ARM repeat-containing protein n=1 Tax=Polyporus arcularius HHB13444 TaxID=1314778 RepID=A0A5C3P5Q2_9APHY|nr:ARM repeat-containing protein [Polyporus arcularius HHB13444]